MENTTTPVDGAATAAQPTATSDDAAQPTEAVTTAQPDQVITKDDNGTPSLEPASQGQPSEQAVEQTQATDKSDSEVAEWAEKKGIKLDPSNPDMMKLARVNLENDRKFHEANQKPIVTPPEELALTGTDIDEVIARQNISDLKLYVRDWFDANPDMKDNKAELTKIASERPWLQNMDDVKAHFLADPNRTAQLKQEGGREALTNLAQKQQAIPPTAGATNSAVYETSAITPQNVSQMVDSHDQAWFEKNHQAISKAMSGN